MDTEQSLFQDSRPIVMISSTVRDLPEHREQVMHACLQQDMFPKMMEHLPASDQDAIAESLGRVNSADIYLGIFAYRYGFIPHGHDVSITELECERAIERGIPILVFLMDKEHAIRIDDVDRGPAAEKVERLKERLKLNHVVNFFRSPIELQTCVINSLSRFRLERFEKRVAELFARLERQASLAELDNKKLAARIDLLRQQSQATLAVEKQRLVSESKIALKLVEVNHEEALLRAREEFVDTLARIGRDSELGQLELLSCVGEELTRLKKEIETTDDVRKSVHNWSAAAFDRIFNMSQKTTNQLIKYFEDRSPNVEAATTG